MHLQNPCGNADDIHPPKLNRSVGGGVAGRMLVCALAPSQAQIFGLELYRRNVGFYGILLFNLSSFFIWHKILFVKLSRILRLDMHHVNCYNVTYLMHTDQSQEG